MEGLLKEGARRVALGDVGIDVHASWHPAPDRADDPCAPVEHAPLASAGRDGCEGVLKPGATGLLMRGLATVFPDGTNRLGLLGFP